MLRHEHIPADLQNVRLTAGSFRTITDASGQAALAIESVGNSEPSRFTLAFETTWQPASRTTLPWLPWFVLPDFAPDAAVSAAVAQAEVAVNEDLPDLSRFSLSDSFGRVIQVGLLYRSPLRPFEHDSVAIVGDESDVGKLRVAAERMTADNEYLSALFGVQLRGRRLYAAFANPYLARDSGGVVNVLASELLWPPCGREELAMQHRVALLAKTWWGVGVRLPGGKGALLSHSICLWAAAKALRDRNGSDGTAWLKSLIDSQLPDRGHVLQAQAADVALRLLHSDDAPVVLGETLTRHYWGQNVPYHTVLADLQKSGCLPRSLQLSPS